MKPEDRKEALNSTREMRRQLKDIDGTLGVMEESLEQNAPEEQLIAIGELLMAKLNAMDEWSTQLEVK